MGMRAFTVAAVAAVLLTMGLGSGVAAPTSDCHDSTTCVNMPLDTVVTNGCNGEPVHVTGTWHSRVGEFGNSLVIYSNFQQTTGVGLETGVLYNVDEQVHSYDRFGPTVFPIEIVLDDHYNVISTKPAQAPNFFLHARFRMVIDSTGPHVKLDDLDTDCRG